MENELFRAFVSTIKFTRYDIDLSPQLIKLNGGRGYYFMGLSRKTNVLSNDFVLIGSYCTSNYETTCNSFEETFIQLCENYKRATTYTEDEIKKLLVGKNVQRIKNELLVVKSVCEKVFSPKELELLVNGKELFKELNANEKDYLEKYNFEAKEESKGFY